MNHFILFNKLMNLKIPPGYITIIKCWYEKLTIAVKWGSAISKFLGIQAGMRQGRILSPFFFAIFVDGCLKKLTKCKFGCYIKGLCMNSIMYADDLILIRFTFNLQVIKQKYYHALNVIFGKTGVNSSPAVLCSLINSFCVHISMYAAESLNWTQNS